MKNLALLLVFSFYLSYSSTGVPGSSFQDPARTSDNRKPDPNRNLDGSSGRYKKDHKHANGKHFATNKKHIKTAKPGKDNGKEKQKPKGSEVGG